MGRADWGAEAEREEENGRAHFAKMGVAWAGPAREAEAARVGSTDQAHDAEATEVRRTPVRDVDAGREESLGRARLTK